jgi:hypothetical protein
MSQARIDDTATDEKGVPIELVDGEQFAKLIVEHGIRSAFDKFRFEILATR